MKEIRIDTGVVQYKLAEDCFVYFNPTDSEFARKLFDVYKYLEGKQEAYRDSLDAEEDIAVIMAHSKEINEEMREAINGIFGMDICTPICGDVSVYAMVDGSPIWANILLAFIDEMTDAFSEEQRKGKAKIDKYTKKYHK